ADECLEDSGICKAGYKCQNTAGSYTCRPGVGYRCRLRIVAIFTIDLYDRYSVTFILYRTRLRSACNRAYSNNPQYIGIIVHGFSPGSVNANVTVLFKEPTTAPLEEIEQAVSNGTFGDLNVSSVVPLPSDDDSSFFVLKEDVKTVKYLIQAVMIVLPVSILIATCLLIAALVKIYTTPKTPPRSVEKNSYSMYNTITTPSRPGDRSNMMRFYYYERDAIFND
ncbi:Neurogenic locus notch 2, partial [Paramuricea clavata]